MSNRICEMNQNRNVQIWTFRITPTFGLDKRRSLSTRLLFKQSSKKTYTFYWGNLFQTREWIGETYFVLEIEILNFRLNAALQWLFVFDEKYLHFLSTFLQGARPRAVLPRSRLFLTQRLPDYRCYAARETSSASMSSCHANTFSNAARSSWCFLTRMRVWPLACFTCFFSLHVILCLF